MYILFPSLTIEGMSSKTGDCTFILFPRGITMMIDAGLPECGERITGMLQDMGVKELNYFVLSHPHSDHIGGGVAVLNYLYENGGKVGHYFHTGHQNKVMELAFQQYLRARGTEVRDDIVEGEKWVIDDVEIEVFGPDAERRVFSSSGTEEINSVSIVLRFAYGRSSYLTAGDIYLRQERWIAQQYGERLASDVTKASHHGLPSSSCIEWLNAVSPRVVIASTDDIGCAKVIRSIYQVGAEYYCTGLDGMVCVSMDNQANYQIMTQYDSVLHHGHNPDKGPQPTFFAFGPDIKAGVEIERRPFVDEAPTYAKILGGELPEADGGAIDEILRNSYNAQK